MKLIYFIATLLFINTTCVLGQVKYYSTNFGWVDGQIGRKIIQANNSNYYLATNQFTLGQWSSCIVYVDTLGNLLNNFYNTDTEDNLVYDMVLANNSCIAVGNISAPPAYHYYSQYLKLDTLSNNISYQALNTNIKNSANACVNTIDEGILLAGSMHNEETEPNSNELHLIKVDSLGVEQWNRTYYAFTGQNTYEDIIALPDGTFYGLATIKDDYWQQANIALLHLSATGIPITIQEYNLNGRDLARCLIPTNDGGILFSASSYPTNDPTEVVQNLYKLNSAGETQWINNADYFVGAVISSLVQLADSTYIVAGSDYSAVPNYLQGFVAKLDTSGSVLWRRSYGGDKDEYLYDLIINNHNSTGKDGYVMCGRTESTDLGVPLGNANIYFLKTNCMGLLTEPQAQFSYTNPEGNTIAFQNLSQYVYPDSLDGGHYLWDFGDGTPPLQTQNTTDTLLHTYPQYGTYTVTLKAIVCTDTSTLQQTLTVGYPPPPPTIEGIVVSPNPTTNQLFINSQEPLQATFVLYNALGQKVGNSSLWGNSTQINVANLPSGIYLYQIINPQNQTLQEGKLSILH